MNISAVIFKSGNETNLLHQLGELTEVKKSSAFFSSVGVQFIILRIRITTMIDHAP